MDYGVDAAKETDHVEEEDLRDYVDDVHPNVGPLPMDERVFKVDVGKHVVAQDGDGGESENVEGDTIGWHFG